MSQSFKGTPTPKILVNSLGAHAVGGVAGVYGASPHAEILVAQLRSQDFADRLVAYANALNKIEIRQINALLAGIHVPTSPRSGH